MAAISCGSSFRASLLLLRLHCLRAERALPLMLLRCCCGEPPVMKAVWDDSEAIHGQRPVFKTLLTKGVDVVPINPDPCLHSLADLPRSVSHVDIHCHPALGTLESLKQAEDLGIFAVWLQPGAEDAGRPGVYGKLRHVRDITFSLQAGLDVEECREHEIPVVLAGVTGSRTSYRPCAA
ncbi:hypothetical protein C8J57DRAFT_1636170 [Mycena rebaudengoi]|nr:hypothetical protein C8J57DRAFT_1636170 [Mycena rebaudengoi]